MSQSRNRELGRTSTGKRKRYEGQSEAQAGHRIINPLSHPPSLLRQFTLAGLAENDEDPTTYIRNFPHRGIDRKTWPTGDADGDAASVYSTNSESDQGSTSSGEDRGNRRKKSSIRGSKSQQPETQETTTGVTRQMHVLLKCIHLFLGQGNVEKAARAFGLVLQLRPSSDKPIDVRQYGLWAIGAEILMRRGEVSYEPATPADDNGSSQTYSPEERTIRSGNRRWGFAENIRVVKAYYDSLIRQYPYDHTRPRNVSLLDFWHAKLSCEVYNAHAEFVIAMENVEGREVSPPEHRVVEDHDVSEQEDSDASSDRNTRFAKLAEGGREELRRRTIATLTGVASSMDDLLRELPYSKDVPLLRLRATTALYIGDLHQDPIQQQSQTQQQISSSRRREEHNKAKKWFAEVLRNGGRLEGTESTFLGVVDIEREPTISPSLYSSLPIREASI